MDKLSPYQQQALRKEYLISETKTYRPTEKLMLTQHHKEKYIVE